MQRANIRHNNQPDFDHLEKLEETATFTICYSCKKTYLRHSDLKSLFSFLITEPFSKLEIRLSSSELLDALNRSTIQ